MIKWFLLGLGLYIALGIYSMIESADEDSRKNEPTARNFPKNPYHGMLYFIDDYNTTYVFNVYTNSWVEIVSDDIINRPIQTGGPDYVYEKTCSKCGINSNWGLADRCPYCSRKYRVVQLQNDN